MPMTPTPFTGDPNTAANEFSPSYFAREPKECNSRQRLTSIAAAVPLSQFTPEQQWWMDNAVGRWGADADNGAHAPVYAMKRHPDGTCDSIMLRAHGKVYLDLGGHGATDVAAGRS